MALRNIVLTTWESGLRVPTKEIAGLTVELEDLDELITKLAEEVGFEKFSFTFRHNKDPRLTLYLDDDGWIHIQNAKGGQKLNTKKNTHNFKDRSYVEILEIVDGVLDAIRKLYEQRLS